MYERIDPLNDEISIELRRCRNILKMTGWGVMVFGLWSVIKACILLLFHLDPEVNRTVDEAIADLKAKIPSQREQMIGIIAVAVIVLILFAVVLLIRYYVYANAKRESAGGKRKNFYLVVASVMMLTSILTFVMIPLKVYKGETELYDAAVSMVIEATSFVTLAELIYSAIMIRKLEKQQYEQ